VYADKVHERNFNLLSVHPAGTSAQASKPKLFTYGDSHFILIVNKLPQDSPTALGQDTPT